jgi:acyl-CoA synthetase (NDP forming)
MHRQEAARRVALSALFRPQSLAIVGASERSMFCRNALDNLRDFQFPGRVELINPRGGSVFGRQTCSSLAALPSPVDLALVLVPTAVVSSVLAEAAGHIRAAIIIASGFAETGRPADVARQRQIVDIAHRGGIRLCGPNVIGVANLNAGLMASGSSYYTEAPAGSIGLISQSGSVFASALPAALERAVGLSILVSSGNEADLGVADYLDFMLDDPNTRVLAAYLESIRDPAAFEQVALRAREQRKPIVVLKTGRTQRAQLAAQAHSAAVAGDDALYDAWFRRLGVIRAETVNDLFDTAALLSQLRPGWQVGGNRLGVITDAGGAGSLVADAADRYGLEVADLTTSSLQTLKALSPDDLIAGNPLDTSGYRHTLEQYRDAVRTFHDMDSVDWVLSIIRPSRLSDQRLGVLNELAAGFSKPLVLTWMDTFIPGAYRDYLQRSDVTSLLGVEDCLRAIAAATRWSQAVSSTLPAASAARPIAAPRRNLMEHEAKLLLTEYGLTTTREELGRTVDEIAAAAIRIGYPVALKLMAPHLLHKTDSGAVRLGVVDESALRVQAAALLRLTSEAEGVLVQEMVQPGLELFIGVNKDAGPLPPLVTVGIGGTLVELYRDVSSEVAPIDRPTAAAMLDRLRLAPLLRGYRGAPIPDREAILDAIGGISELSLALGTGFRNLDVNPLVVWPGRPGAVVVDAKMVASSSI